MCPRRAPLARVARLSDAGQAVAAAAAVLGRRTEAGLLAGVSGQSLAAVGEGHSRGVLVAEVPAWASGTSWPGWPSRVHFPRISALPPMPGRWRSSRRWARLTTGGWRTMPPEAATAPR
jgi:hypothetical protein